MKQTMQRMGIMLLVLFVGPISLAFGQTSIMTAVRYDAFKENSSPGSSGNELTMPLGIAHRWESLFLNLTSAYSKANVDPGDETEARLSSFTDTLLSMSYTYFAPQHSMALISGVDVNFPTGKATLNRYEARAEAGQRNDLFEVDNFGEGLNVGLNLGLSKEFERTTLALHGAYIYKGRFDPSAENPDITLKPGDQALLIGQIDWRVSPWLDLAAIASYSYFSPDMTNEEEIFQEGQRVVLGTNAWVKHKPILFLLSLQYAIHGKSKLWIEETLLEEPENSNGNDFFGLMSITYNVSPSFNVHLLGDIRYYGSSDLTDEETGLPFVGERIRYAAGPGFRYFLNEHLSCNGLFKAFSMNQQPDVFLEDTTFQGINFDLGLTYTF